MKVQCNFCGAKDKYKFNWRSVSFELPDGWNLTEEADEFYQKMVCNIKCDACSVIEDIIR